MLFLYLVMKKMIINTVLFFAFFFGEVAALTFADSPPSSPDTIESFTEDNAYSRGEKLKYRIHYGWIDAGEAVLEITKETKILNEKKTLHMVGTGRTVGSFNWFYKVRDRYETYMDEESMVPLKFVRRVNEGGYIINQDQLYDHENNTVNSDGKIMDVPPGIQDMLSSFYAARNFDLSTAQPGDELFLTTFMDDEIFPLRIRYMGKETIKSEKGKIRCLKFHPVVQQGRVFNAEEDVTVWISDDKNHIPISIEAKLFVGSAKMDLKDYSGLTHPIEFK